METRKKPETRTAVVTLTKGDGRKAMEMGVLTEEEERYVRVRFGIGEPASAPVPRRGQQFEETRARLALMEAALVAGRLPRPTSTSPVKDRIIERLKGR